MTKIIVLNPFTIDLDSHAKLHGIEFNDVSMTVQSDARQADINFIVEQFGLTQQLPYGLSVPQYDDYSDAPNDFHSAMNYIKDSENLFMQYPADIRSRFNNDPGQFLDFISNPDNRSEAISLGFVDAPLEQGSADPAESGATLPAQGDA